MNRPRRNVPPPSISSSQATRKIKLGRNHQCQNLPRVLSPSERQQHVDAYASSREQNSSESPSKSAQISKKTETSPNIKSIQPPSTRSPPPSPPNTRARLLDLTVWHTPFPAHMQWDTDLFVGFARKRKRSRRTVQMGSASISEWKEFSFADHFNNRDQFFDMNPLPESKKVGARELRESHIYDNSGQRGILKKPSSPTFFVPDLPRGSSKSVLLFMKGIDKLASCNSKLPLHIVSGDNVPAVRYFARNGFSASAVRKLKLKKALPAGSLRAKRKIPSMTEVNQFNEQRRPRITPNSSIYRRTARRPRPVAIDLTESSPKKKRPKINGITHGKSKPKNEKSDKPALSPAVLQNLGPPPP
eukprot:101159_1